MFNSTILDVAIGLTFTFLAVSLATGAIVEAISSFFNIRASTLLQGIKDMLNDQGFNKLALKLYQHAAINPRGPGVKMAGAVGQDAQTDAKTRAPSYIDPHQFAVAMVDILGLSDASAAAPAPGPAAVAAFTTAINDALKDQPPQIKDFLIGVVQRTQGDLTKIRTELSQWFDTSMDRLSGVFKRWRQFYSVAIALAMCVVFNIDCLKISKALWEQPKLAEQLKLSPDLVKLLQSAPTPVSNTALASLPQDEATAMSALSGLNQQLPVGWPDNPEARWFSHVLGWLVTALATLFGAPFWFDMLQTFTRLKGTGPSPAEKTAKTGASA